MAHPTLTPGCRFIVGIHGKGPWEGFEKPCGFDRNVRKDPRSQRYDDVLCSQHMAVVLAELEHDAMPDGET